MKNFLLMLPLLIISLITRAQPEDAGGCKDHPMFNRMPNFYIDNCKQNFDNVTVWMSSSNSKDIEGYKTEISYVFDTESGKSAPSFFQIVKNYENSLAKNGVKRIYLGGTDATLYFKTGTKEVWIQFNAPSSEASEAYTLTILEVEAMKQDIQAQEMLDALNTAGHVALYINFETGKSEIKPESQKIVDQIAEMLKSSPSLKVSIEGHTDNVGNAASNQTLSENRAKAVVAALIAKGIDKSRLVAKGWGQTKPVADNATDAGKAQNRRVEIVKL